MKKITTLFILLLIAALTITAQPPQAFKYKAIARDMHGRLIMNQPVAMRISILQGSEIGTPVYIETHTPYTNLYGVIELEIGNGTPELGTISAIDWGVSDYYIKIEMDPKNKGKGHGNEGYTVIGTSQLLSVPYALYAGHVKNSEDNDADPLNELITSAYLSGTILNLQEGGTTTLIDLSGLQDGTEDADADPENEIQDLQLVDNILTITQNGTATEIDLSVYLDDTDTHLTEAEVDAMVENNGYLKDFAWADISDVPADLADGDDNTQLSENEVDAMVANNGYLTGEVDGSVINEVQDLSLTGDELTLPQDATPVDLAKYLDNTDNQTLFSVLTLGNNASGMNITNLADPINNQDAATKAYVDATGGGVESETDPLFTASQAANITDTDITNLGNLSGTNTGDQDLSGFLKNETDPSVPSGTQTGQMQYWNGSAWVIVAPGIEGQVLTFFGGVPIWKTPVGLGDVENPITGKTWMDRNLGAYQVATSSIDDASYGDLYQWGRATDGHEKRTSGTTSTLSSSDTPGHGDFITIASSPYDWHSPQNDNLWQGVSGTNNPCPSGYRLPTEAEWGAERLSWPSYNAAGAFGSILRLPATGYRAYNDGTLGNVDSTGSYWSSTVKGTYSRSLYFGASNADMNSFYRAYGFSVRCLKD